MLSSEHISRYKSLDFFARQVVEGFITGRHKSPFHGFSVEFSDYRQYNNGESTKNIDWHLYGRTDRLYIKQFEEETNLRCQILIDQSRSMLFPTEHHGDIDHPNKLTFAVYAAAVLIELLHRQRDAFGLTLFSSHIDQQTPCRSSSVHQQYLLGELDKLLNLSDTHSPSPSGTNISEALHLTAEQLHKRSLVVLFTDAFSNSDTQEDLFDALRHLRHNKHEVIIFHTYDFAHEVNLDYDARPHLFIDLESGRQLKLQPNEIADAYRRQMTNLFSTLRQTAIQYHIEYVPVDIAQGFHQVMLPFLLKRSKQNP
ncbi:MAG: DUF58 domain-containing protein [Bacteroidales bacterium]|nr:DUF58 domain-containing protein [Bacteroidales bacterium]